MKRRALLATVGTGIASLSGCLAAADGQATPDSTPGTPPATPRSTPPVNTGGLDDFEPSSTYRQVEVGSREGVDEKFGPHDLVVWNSYGSEQPVSLRILDRVRETTTHRAGYTIPADAAIEVTLLTPSKYYVQLWGPAIDTPETLLVPCDLFDCNASATRIGILENGRVRSSVISTLAGCPSTPEC